MQKKKKERDGGFTEPVTGLTSWEISSLNCDNRTGCNQNTEAFYLI